MRFRSTGMEVGEQGVAPCCAWESLGGDTAGLPAARLNRHPRGGDPLGRLSKATWVYVIAVVVTAAVLIVRGPLSGIDWPMLAVLAILFLVCESSSAPSGPRQFTWSASYAATLASVVLLGPVGAAIVGTAAALRLRRGLLVVQRLFN